MAQILVALVRSTNSASKQQIKIVEALGLRKIGDCAVHQDNAAIRGMARKVEHLVVVESLEEEE